MEISPDWKELLELFNAHRVEYVVIGAHAVGLHGHPRATKDLDLLVKPSNDNAKRVMAALRECGFGESGLTEKISLCPIFSSYWAAFPRVSIY